MTGLTRHAYAKINLTLDVGARRPDGYHDIRSVMQTVALHDSLTIIHTPDVPGVRLEVTGDEAGGVPADESNLVHRAAVRLQKIAAARGSVPGNRSGLHISLHKRIPSQAGLGGGSSDAAAALLTVNDMLGLALPHARLAEIGAVLGADVPFFLTGGTALVEGLGERVTTLPLLSPSWSLVIVKPPVGVSTAAAYAALDALPERVPGTATEVWLRGGRDPANDFEQVIFPHYAEVAAAHALFCQTGQTDKSFRPVLCGSGACVFRRTSSWEEGSVWQEKWRPLVSAKSGWRGRKERTNDGVSQMSVDVVVLAGGKNSAQMAAATGVENRALTPLGARTMLDYVTTALRGASSVGEIYVVGEVPAGNTYHNIKGGETLLDNLMAGLQAAEAGVGGGERVLISTSDIPFLTPEAVEDFIRRAAQSGADLCCSYVPVELCYARFPDMKRTAIKLREGSLTLGNLMLVNPHFLRTHQDTISQAYAARKSPIQIARMLGLGLPARLLLAQFLAPSLLTVGALEQAVSRLLGSGARATGIRSEYPEIGTDVDKPEDVAIARRMLTSD